MHAFVDESKAAGLVLVAAVLHPRNFTAARQRLRALCLPGQSRLHFTKERPARRRQIADAVVQVGAAVDIYDARAIVDARLARAVCLRQLVAVLAAEHGQRLVLEQDDSLVERDRVVLYDAVRAAGAESRLSYMHLPARSEPLLWLPDAVAWCWTHDSQWRARIAPAVRAVRQL